MAIDERHRQGKRSAISCNLCRAFRRARDTAGRNDAYFPEVALFDDLPVLVSPNIFRVPSCAGLSRRQEVP
jgi:hypothetical protein